jgi:hypothetical protein
MDTGSPLTERQPGSAAVPGPVVAPTLPPPANHGLRISNPPSVIDDSNTAVGSLSQGRTTRIPCGSPDATGSTTASLLVGTPYGGGREASGPGGGRLPLGRRLLPSQLPLGSTVTQPSDGAQSPSLRSGGWNRVMQLPPRPKAPVALPPRYELKGAGRREGVAVRSSEHGRVATAAAAESSVAVSTNTAMAGVFTVTYNTLDTIVAEPVSSEKSGGGGDGGCCSCQ